MIFMTISVLLLMQIFIQNQVDENIDTEVKVVDVIKYDTYKKLTVKDGLNKYHMYTYDDKLDIGDQCYINARIQPYDHQSVPFGFDPYTNYLSKGIKGKITDYEIINIKQGFSIYKIRNDLLRQVDENYIRYLVFGEKADDDTKHIYQNLDIAFLLNVSGIHVFILMIGVKKICFNFNISDKNQVIIICVLYGLLLYLSRFDLSILRLSISYLIIIVTKKYSIKIMSIDRLCLTFIILLLTNIYLMYSVGFLMMLIILLAIDLISPIYKKQPIFIQRYLTSTLIVCMLLPFQNHINLLYLVFVPIIMLYMTLIIYPLSILTFIFDDISIILRFTTQLYEHSLIYLNTFSYTIRFHAFNHAFKFIIYITFVYLLFSKNARQILKRVIIFISILSLPTIYFNHVEQDMFYMIDVGQGDGTYLKLDDKHIVVDAFKGTKSFLENHGVYHIDYLILTHSDIDHIYEAQDMINALDVDIVIINAYDDYGLANATIKRYQARDHIILNDRTIKFYNPIVDLDDSNNNSLAFKVHIGDLDFIFCGDIEKEAEIKMIETFEKELKSDVIKIAHHGSNTSSSKMFIETVSPSYALISVGKNNKYDFPASETINLLNQYQIKTYRTDINGTIIYAYKFKHGKWRYIL